MCLWPVASGCWLLLTFVLIKTSISSSVLSILVGEADVFLVEFRDDVLDVELSPDAPSSSNRIRLVSDLSSIGCGEGGGGRDWNVS